MALRGCPALTSRSLRGYGGSFRPDRILREHTRTQHLRQVRAQRFDELLCSLRSAALVFARLAIELHLQAGIVFVREKLNLAQLAGNFAIAAESPKRLDRAIEQWRADRTRLHRQQLM